MSETIEPTAPAPSSPRTATRLKSVEFSGGLQPSLQTAAVVFLWIGLLAGAVPIILAFTQGWAILSASLTALGVWTSAVFSWLLLKALAEVLGFLRYLAGPKTGAGGSLPHAHETFNCSACGAGTSSIIPNCFHCGAEFEK